MFGCTDQDGLLDQRLVAGGAHLAADAKVLAAVKLAVGVHDARAGIQRTVAHAAAEALGREVPHLVVHSHRLGALRNFLWGEGGGIDKD